VTIKEKALRAIQDLPEDADYQAVAERLDFIKAVDEGLEQAERVRILSADQVRERLSRWLSE
jgi:hypothetical protein